MNYLLYEEMCIRSAGVDDSNVIDMCKWNPVSDLTVYRKTATVWFRQENKVSLGFTDGKEMWWTDGAIDPQEFSVIAETDNKVSIRVEFDDDGEEEGEEPAPVTEAENTEPTTEN